jgi:hypothetical protein
MVRIGAKRARAPMYSGLRVTNRIRQDDGRVTAGRRIRPANWPRTSWLPFAAVGQDRTELRFARDYDGRLSRDSAAEL